MAAKKNRLKLTSKTSAGNGVHKLRSDRRAPLKAALVALILAVLGLALLYRSHAAVSGPDINGDGKVNITDLSTLLTNYNKTGSDVKGDVNGDGKVNITDLSMLLSAFGKPVGGNASSPGQLLDLHNWYLGLPTGDDGSDSVYQPKLATYTSEFFKLNAAKDGVVFMAPVEGSTTSNSSHTRSELRETSSDGTLPWGWPTGSGRHVLTATESIDHLPGGNGKLSFAQIHGPGSVWYLILMATGTGDGTAKLTVKDETGKADGQVIASSYKLGTKFNLVVSAIDGKVTVSFDGKQVVSTTNDMDDSYFKIGSYNQSDGDYGQTTVYSLKVEHD